MASNGEVLEQVRAFGGPTRWWIAPLEMRRLPDILMANERVIGMVRRTSFGSAVAFCH